MLRTEEDKAKDPGEAVRWRVTLRSAVAAFPERSFTISQHFVFSCTGRMWGRGVHTYGRRRCCRSQESAGWEVCTSKCYPITCSLPKKSICRFVNCSLDLWGALTYRRGSAPSREDYTAILKTQKASVGEPSTTHTFCQLSLQAEKPFP